MVRDGIPCIVMTQILQPHVKPMGVSVLRSESERVSGSTGYCGRKTGAHHGDIAVRHGSREERKQRQKEKTETIFHEN